eukprot:scaffold89542_cov33-Tisochrysis_lutea.AAC.1
MKGRRGEWESRGSRRRKGGPLAVVVGAVSVPVRASTSTSTRRSSPESESAAAATVFKCLDIVGTLSVDMGRHSTRTGTKSKRERHEGALERRR